MIIAREIPVDEGNKAEVTVTLLHQNFIGVDEFLGRIALPLVDFDVYETPKIRYDQSTEAPQFNLNQLWILLPGGTRCKVRSVTRTKQIVCVDKSK